MDLTATTSARTGPLLVTDDVTLRHDVLRLCAAVGVTPATLASAEEARSRWRQASYVLVGADVAPDLVACRLARRADVLLVATSGAPAETWRQAVALGAEQVVTLPHAQDELVGWLADNAEGAPGGCLVGVVGARGGVGASTFAASVVLDSACRRDTCLVDADPLGAGIELVLGIDDAPGLRWSDVAVTRGRVGASALREALPQHQGVTVLSHGRGLPVRLEPTVMRSLLAAARRTFDAVVVDLPRSLDDVAREAASSVDHVLLVAGCDARSVATASVLLPGLLELGCDIGLVVRSGRLAPTSADVVAEALGLPLAGIVPTRRGLGRRVDEGLGPGRRSRSVRLGGQILDDVLARGGA